MFHFYITAMLWVAAYTLFAYSITIFLNDALKSPFWVGLFMGFGSIAAFIMDVPFGYLQKVFSTRFLLAASVIGLMISVGIFLMSYTQGAFLALAALIYGLSHDLYDVTMFSYIFDRTIPAEYAQNLSQKSVSESLGIFVGLLFSGFLLQFGPFYAQLGLEVILLASLIVILLIFDRDWSKEKPSEEPVQEVVTHRVQQLTSSTLSGLKNTAIAIMDVTEKGLSSMRQSLEKNKIVLKPLVPYWRNLISLKLINEMKEAFMGMLSIVRGEKVNVTLLWSVCILFMFSFWDTFVITFEPLFLVKFLAGKEFPRILTGGVIMTMFILPLFVCLIPFSRWADKYGRHNFIIGGLLVSGISLIFFGFTENIYVMIAMGMTNSVGYAAVMPAVQALFAERFNEHMAISEGKTEIDTNASAAPLKMVTNFGNIFGQIIGGTLVYMLGFNAVFMIFGLGLVITFAISMMLYFILKKPPYVIEEGKAQAAPVAA